MVGVSAERDELRRLVEDLPEAEVPAAVAELRLRVALTDGRQWPPSWFGAAWAAGATPRLALTNC